MVQVSVIMIMIVRRMMGGIGPAYAVCSANRSENYAELRRIALLDVALEQQGFKSHATLAKPTDVRDLANYLATGFGSPLGVLQRKLFTRSLS